MKRPSTRNARETWIPVLLLSLASTVVASAAPSDGIRLRIEALRAGTEARAGGERLLARHALPAVYESRSFAPAWEGADEAAAELLAWITDVARYGLEPTDYHRAALTRLKDARSAAAREDRDLLLTDAFLILGSHLVSGRLHPQTFDPEWIAVRREVDLVAALDRALGGFGVSATLAGLQPQHPGYLRLADALASYRRLDADGEWPVIDEGERLEIGSTGPRVATLRRRLARTGDLEAEDGDQYDRALHEAVTRFQTRHGLTADGKVGPLTLQALNVSPGARARLIELNLERWRWLPVDLGQRYVLVNLPAFHLEVVDAGERALEMRVIVGRPYRRTPVFSDLMRYVVLNPYWEVPPSIAVQDKLPLIRQDPLYLAANGFRVYSGWGENERSIDPATIDWSTVNRSTFPYRLRQDPGPLNALGRVKFMFPNAFNVYLHDTPSRELFASPDRSLSSGCIRLEQPVDLAAVVLNGTPGWDRAAIGGALASQKTVTVNLAQPMPVHLQHWTSWVQDDGSVAFRNDLYGRDERLDLALRERHEALASAP
jgi:murein L,D-transpeptidase YcbB/YkuD